MHRLARRPLLRRFFSEFIRRKTADTIATTRGAPMRAFDSGVVCGRCYEPVRELASDRRCPTCAADLLVVGLVRAEPRFFPDVCGGFLRVQAWLVAVLATLALIIEDVFVSTALRGGVWLHGNIGLGMIIVGSLVVWRGRRRFPSEAAPTCGRCGYDIRGSGERCPECGSALLDVGVRIVEKSTARIRAHQLGAVIVLFPLLLYAVNAVVGLMRL